MYGKTIFRYAYENTTTQKQRKTIYNMFCSRFLPKRKSQLEADTGGLEGLGRPAARFHVTVPMRVVARAHVCTIKYLCIGRYALIYQHSRLRNQKPKRLRQINI